jgi:hypothetical protein
VELLAGANPVDVLDIHFSLAQSDESPLGKYTESGVNNAMHLLGNPDLYELTLNATAHKRKVWSSNVKNYKKLWQTEDVPATGLVILSGTGWSITMIAGNVRTTVTTEDYIRNTASICTLAKCGTEKLLLTGDALSETMTYLLNFHKAQITDVSILQVPHHGSGGSEPTPLFRDTVNPVSIIISVSQQCNKFHMPTKAVIDNWNSAGRLRKAPIVLDVEYWVYAVEGYDDTDGLNEILKETWKNFKVENNGKSFWWLANPANAEGNTGFYGFTRNFFFLYRKRWTKDIYLTGVMNTYEQGFKSGKMAQPPVPASLPPA